MIVFLIAFSAFMIGGTLGSLQARREYEPLLERLLNISEQLAKKESKQDG